MASLQVIIPVYNGDAFLGQTIDSVLKQGEPGLELVILDNASTDGTAAIAESYRNRGVRHVRNPTNVGGIGNHNLALQIATADYVKLLSADDVLLPGVLAKQRAVLDAHPAVGLATCNCIVTDSALNPRGETHYLPGHMRGDAAIAAAVGRVTNIIGAPSNLMMRRSCIGETVYDKSLKWLADLDFACQILRRSEYFNIDEPGFLYRRHEASDTAVSCSPEVRLHDEMAFIDRYRGGIVGRARVLYRFARRGELGAALLPSRVRRGM